MPYQPSYYVPPPPPPTGYAPQRGGGSGVVIAIAVILALFLGAGVAVYALTARGMSPPAAAVSSSSAPVSSSASGSPVNAEAAVIVETPPEPRTSAEFRDVGASNFSDGRMWIGRYFNTGETVIGSGGVTLSLFDESGKRLVEQAGYLDVDWLEPGQFTLVNVWVPKVPAFSRYELKVKCEPVSEYVSKPLPIAITEQSVRKSSTFSSEFVGTVKNTSSVKVQFIKVVVYGYDDKGAPSCVAYSYATEKELAPGGESGFSVNLGGINVGTPVRYAAQAFARAK
ncbi:hypothetical protein PLCT2_01491 [Planctomycetaceae bacterium]|nr:hypothetical protein PLCT2_01491 [Planctomycetaceae bacterium]